MRKNLIGIVIVAVLLISGCINYPCINGSGNVISETRTVDAFHSVDLELMGNLYVTQTGESEVRIEADDNILPLLKTDVRNGVLIIKRDGNRCLRPTKINVYVSMDEVKRLSLSGQGDIISQSTITSDNLELSISGQGDIDMDVNTSKLTTSLSGQGDARYTGTATSHEVTISGTGDIDAYELTTEKTLVRVSGAGDAEVFASNELDVKISGAGNVHYKGDPKTVNQDISGAGKVNKMD